MPNQAVLRDIVTNSSRFTLNGTNIQVGARELVLYADKPASGYVQRLAATKWSGPPGYSPNDPYNVLSLE